MAHFFHALILCMMPTIMCAQITIPLYPAEIPNSKPTSEVETIETRNGIALIGKISKLSLTIFTPAKPKGRAVIICPGRGYWTNASVHEGSDVAKELSEWGVTAFVLKYRIPNDATMVNKEIGPLQDVQQAIKVVRGQAKEFGIEPNRIGVMGFSAGGHVASTVATHFANPVISNPEKINLRPDFTLLIHPVISFQNTIGHIGSRNQFIGKNSTQQKTDEYSNEYYINTETPPAFLVHAGDDNGVVPENSIVYYQQLVKNKVPAELHLYEKGEHGFVTNNPTTQNKWMDRLHNWMKLSNRIL